MLGRHALAAESTPLTIVKEMEEMFLRLGFNQTVAQKLVEDQGIDSQWTLACFSDEDITTICDVMRRSEGLVGRRTPERGDQVSMLSWKTSSLQCSY